MPYGFKATKGKLTSYSTSKSEKAIDKRAKKLRKAGWKVKVYEIKRHSH